jgi:uncharacterized membrane protein YoaK (UPF0700 family)
MANNDANRLANMVIGLVLVVLGVLFLLGQLFGINLLQFTWPLFIIVPGLLFFVGMVLGGKKVGGLAIPGSIVTMVGLILLYQNLSNHWESWAYAWALVFPTSVGIGLIINGAWSGQGRIAQEGKRWIKIGIIIFVVGGVFFESIIGISGRGVRSIVWPVLLILLGAYLIVMRGGILSRSRMLTQQGEGASKPVESASTETSGENRSNI